MAALMSSSSFLLKPIFFALIDLALLSCSFAACSLSLACSVKAACPTFFGIPKDNLATPQDRGLAASTVIGGFRLLRVLFSDLIGNCGLLVKIVDKNGVHTRSYKKQLDPLEPSCKIKLSSN